jgi:hypothetical protein
MTNITERDLARIEVEEHHRIVVADSEGDTIERRRAEQTLALVAELREARAALEPFAKLGRLSRHWAWADDEKIVLTTPMGAECTTYTFGDFRRAARIAKEAQGED